MIGEAAPPLMGYTVLQLVEAEVDLKEAPVADKSLVLEIPDSLYERLRRQAATTRRSIQAEAVDALAAGLAASDEVPDAIADQVAFLDLLDDDAVWRAARSRLNDQDDARLAELNDKADRTGLTEAETRESAMLIERGEDIMVIRAKAASVLARRGYDIAELLPTG